MIRSVFIPGLVVFIAGVALLGYGFKYASDLDALIKASEWDVTWYRVIDPYGTWGDVIGHSTLPPKFGRTTITYEYDDVFVDEEFGFKATMNIELLRDSTVVFQTGSDDGVMLYVDGELIVNSWVLRGYTLDEPVHVPLSAGTHILEMWWYEWHTANEASFDMYVEEYETARNMQTAGGGVLFIGLIVTIIGLILRPRVKI